METRMIGSKIVKARKAAHLSQAQLAQRLFISPQAVGKWERGESVPDIFTLNRLAELLHVDLNYFSEHVHSTADAPASAMPALRTGATEQPVQDYADKPGPQERQLLTDFSGSNLAESDFSGVVAHKRTFHGSALRGANFAGADLTGSSFTASDAREASFDGTNLTECTLSAVNLTGASFHKTILVRTAFSASELAGATFTDVQLIDVRLTATDLRTTSFHNCSFHGVDFKSADLRGLCLDGQTFTGVRFDRAALNDATFRGATLRNVSFRATYALTNKYYRALNTICFDGAMMDKLTYAALKGVGVELSTVTVI